MEETKVTKKNFQEILNNEELVIFDFSMKYCGPCEIQTEIFENCDLLKKLYPNIKIFKIKQWKDKGLSKAFGIHHFPTIMLYINKTIFKMNPGIRIENKIINTIKKIEENSIKKEKEIIHEKKFDFKEYFLINV